jgi:hypothetical protein
MALAVLNCATAPGEHFAQLCPVLRESRLEAPGFLVRIKIKAVDRSIRAKSHRPSSDSGVDLPRAALRTEKAGLPSCVSPWTDRWETS